MTRWQAVKDSFKATLQGTVLRKCAPSPIILATCVTLVCLFLIVSIALVKRGGWKKASPSPPHSLSQELHEAIQTVDQVIAHTFARLSITEDQVSLKQFQQRSERTEWNYTVWTITLPPHLSFHQIITAFTRGFSFFAIENLTYEINVEVNTLTIEIRIGGVTTHRLIFSSPAPPVSQPHRKGKAQVSIVIDDLGQNYTSFTALLALDIPITFSILPFEPHSVRIAQEAFAREREVMLHLPMEPWDARDTPHQHG